jgi:hypothetical protein
LAGEQVPPNLVLLGAELDIRSRVDDGLIGLHSHGDLQLQTWYHH